MPRHSVAMVELKHYISLALVIISLFCFCLQTTVNADEVNVTDSISVIDQSILDGEIANFISKHENLSADNFSLGYCFTPTGETYFYNGDKWYDSSNLYYVPLCMLYAAKEHNGVITADTEIDGVSLEYAEKAVLEYANSDYAYLLTREAGSQQDCLQQCMEFTSLDSSYFTKDYTEDSKFTARYMTEVLENLYYNSDNFPRITDYMASYEPNSAFHTYLRNCSISQIHGNYSDGNHVAGIIYTESPFILVIMTENAGDYNTVAADASQLLAEYTDDIHTEYLSQVQTQEEKKAAEEEAEAERKAKEEEKERIEAQRKADAAAIAEQNADWQKVDTTSILSVRFFFVTLAGLAAAVLGLVEIRKILTRSKQNQKTYHSNKEAGAASKERVERRNNNDRH